MLKKIVRFSLLSALLLTSVAQAGIIMGGTRVVYLEGKKEASLSVTNEDKKTPYLVQTWTENFDSNNKNIVPFIVTPPLFRLDPEKENILRISYTGAILPKDRESVFWLNIKSISPSVQSDPNQLLINIKSKFKIFYRPKGLAGSADEAYKQLTFNREGNHLVGHNPTPYFVSFSTLSVGGDSIDNPGMIGPGENRGWTVTGQGEISWSAINDYGGITEIEKR